MKKAKDFAIEEILIPSKESEKARIRDSPNEASFAERYEAAKEAARRKRTKKPRRWNQAVTDRRDENDLQVKSRERSIEANERDASSVQSDWTNTSSTSKKVKTQMTARLRSFSRSRSRTSSDGVLEEIRSKSMTLPQRSQKKKQHAQLHGAKSKSSVRQKAHETAIRPQMTTMPTRKASKTKSQRKKGKSNRKDERLYMALTTEGKKMTRRINRAKRFLLPEELDLPWGKYLLQCSDCVEDRMFLMLDICDDTPMFDYDDDADDDSSAASTPTSVGGRSTSIATNMTPISENSSCVSERSIEDDTFVEKVKMPRKFASKSSKLVSGFGTDLDADKGKRNTIETRYSY